MCTYETAAGGNYIWKYSGSLFIPEANAQEEIKILMESGKKGGRGNKNAALINVLQVKDPCTADFDGDEAVIQLPPCEGGYDVYVRALAKPTGDPSLTIENVGLKGYTIGGMSFSSQHANFLVNLGDGIFDEAIKLIQLAQQKVKTQFNIELELEIIIL